MNVMATNYFLHDYYKKIKSQIEIPTLNLVVRRKAMQKVLTLHVTNK